MGPIQTLSPIPDGKSKVIRVRPQNSAAQGHRESRADRRKIRSKFQRIAMEMKLHS
jgi:hypothetical protein